MSIREILLDSLKCQKGRWVSGEDLSSRLSVSRAAIWKHIRRLREEGYEILSSPKKGYLLEKIPDRPFPREILEGLNTRRFGKEKIRYFEVTDSTNQVAKDLAAAGAPEGTLVVAEAQGKGRGRLGRKWYSPVGEGIYASLILRPRIPLSEAPLITCLAAVAVAEAVMEISSLDVKIKWPNDLLVGGRKLAGILTEIATEMDAVEYLVLGLGLNVNTRSFPASLKTRATSLLRETGAEFSRTSLIQGFLRWCEKYYWIFQESGFDPILRRWKQLSLLLGKRVRVETVGGILAGTATDVDPSGCLILVDDRGEEHHIFSGDILSEEPSTKLRSRNLAEKGDNQ